MKYIFLSAGRTGGPLMPLVSIISDLEAYTPVIIGIKNSFESKYASEHGILFVSLFESKSQLHSFKSSSYLDKIRLYLQGFWAFSLLCINIVKSIYLQIQYKPKGVISAGGFTAVPMILASRVTNFVGLTKTKIIIHQQDPDVGLTNKITARFADYLSCVFESTKRIPPFEKAIIIPNPLDTEAFDSANSKVISNDRLNNFYANSTQPILLVYGGGSGSQSINNWVWDNSQDLLSKFDIIHLTGILQNDKPKSVLNTNYIGLPSLSKEMPYILKRSDVIICRAGLGSISELLYLQKSAFLVPLPRSHQENNAREVSKYFEILEEKDMSDWASVISKKYPNEFSKKVYPNPLETEQKLNEYTSKIKGILDKS